MDLVEFFSDEIWNEVLGLLWPRDLLVAGWVDRRLRELSRDPRLWREYFQTGSNRDDARFSLVRIARHHETRGNARCVAVRKELRAGGLVACLIVHDRLRGHERVFRSGCMLRGSDLGPLFRRGPQYASRRLGLWTGGCEKIFISEGPLFEVRETPEPTGSPRINIFYYQADRKFIMFARKFHPTYGGIYRIYCNEFEFKPRSDDKLGDYFLPGAVLEVNVSFDSIFRVVSGANPKLLVLCAKIENMGREAGEIVKNQYYDLVAESCPRLKGGSAAIKKLDFSRSTRPK
jgi:hypothetical protein